MASLNSTLFLWINATPESPHWLLMLATFFASDMIGIAPVLITAFWLWGPKGNLYQQRVLVLKTIIALIYAMIISWCLSLLFTCPQPFVVGLGHQFLHHQSNDSYPGNHSVVIFTFGLAFLCWHRLWSAITLLTFGTIISWAHIYLGVHWPLDILCGLVVGALACLFSQMAWQFYGDTFMQRCSLFYRWLFAIPIRKGWMRD